MLTNEVIVEESKNIQPRSDFDVDLVDGFGSDELICKAARVSTLGAASLATGESFGFLNFLMSNRHGSPFEHNSMMFRISAPIFVWREFMRHRIGFSYNEESGRYKELEPVFYLTPTERPLIQFGKPGEYKFRQGESEDHHLTTTGLAQSYAAAWHIYQTLLDNGIAREVARMCLPVGIYSTAYVTCNARSLMSFLSLRTKVEGSMFMSYPQWEIDAVASLMEGHFERLFPLTHKAFVSARRVSP